MVHRLRRRAGDGAVRARCVGQRVLGLVGEEDRHQRQVTILHVLALMILSRQKLHLMLMRHVHRHLTDLMEPRSQILILPLQDQTRQCGRRHI